MFLYSTKKHRLYIEQGLAIIIELLGRIEKGIGCSITDCSNSATRSLSRDKGGTEKLKISDEGKRIYLCQLHYKNWKKESKKYRELERVRYG